MAIYKNKNMKKILSILVLSSFVLSIFSFTFNNKVKAQSYYNSQCISIQNNLKVGSQDYYTNGEVSELQIFLANFGYLNSAPTGYFGYMTKRAVASYQRDSGIYATGYVGQMTRDAIYNDSCINQNNSNNNINNTYYCSLNNIYYINYNSYQSGCVNQNTNSYYCSINGQTYYDWYSYNNGCHIYTNNYYCSINGITYLDYNSYNLGCRNITPVNTICPISSSFGDVQNPSCSCPLGYTKEILPTFAYNPSVGAIYQCKQTVVSSNVCPIDLEVSYAISPSVIPCTCPANTHQVFIYYPNLVGSSHFKCVY